MFPWDSPDPAPKSSPEPKGGHRGEGHAGGVPSVHGHHTDTSQVMERNRSLLFPKPRKPWF